jgi:uncharacterized lipoprotein YddW (UPF0748 family)
MTRFSPRSSRSRQTLLVFVLLWLGAAPDGVKGQNLVANPSAEKADDTGRPQGWGMYVGAGGAKLTVVTAMKHSGQSCARLELTEWYTEGGVQQANAAMVLARNNGYSAQGAISCSPGANYVYGFWYKGDFQSATVSVIGWPDVGAVALQRVEVETNGSALHPTPVWQRCAGTFRTGINVHCFALLIRLSATRTAGKTLGTIYVDDAQIREKAFPGSRIRGLWGYLKSEKREEGLQEIQDTLGQIQRAGINSVFIWVSSLYIAALDRPELRRLDPQSEWDALGEILKAAREHSLQVHAWYSPWINKAEGEAVELRDHPEWAAVDATGKADDESICFMRPEVRQYELHLIENLLNHYPDLAGVHIEEPGLPEEYCYCGFCHRLWHDWYGTDIPRDLASNAPLRESLKAAMCTDFIVRLRQTMQANWPGVWLSANGGGGDGAMEWKIGRDWVTWAHRGYVDFYVPQLYTEDAEDFISQAKNTKETLGPCNLVTGIGVNWTGMSSEWQKPEVLREQILASEQIGSKGFIVFRLDHLRDEHFVAIHEALETIRAGTEK